MRYSLASADPSGEQDDAANDRWRMEMMTPFLLCIGATLLIGSMFWIVRPVTSSDPFFC
jgi:hypothetical protein